MRVPNICSVYLLALVLYANAGFNSVGLFMKKYATNWTVALTTESINSPTEQFCIFACSSRAYRCASFAFHISTKLCKISHVTDMQPATCDHTIAYQVMNENGTYEAQAFPTEDSPSNATDCDKTTSTSTTTTTTSTTTTSTTTTPAATSATATVTATVTNSAAATTSNAPTLSQSTTVASQAPTTAGASSTDSPSEGVCGAVRGTFGGVLSSPNYPSPYPPNLNCEWHITLPVGRVIELDIKQIDLDTDQLCANEYFMVLEAGTLEEIIPKTCGLASSSQVAMNTNSIIVKFVSSSVSSSRVGWLLKWFPTFQASDCGESLLTGTEGNLTSLFYPETYQNNVVCQWEIDVPTGYISFQFSHIDIESTMQCRADFLEIQDRRNRAKYVYCGLYADGALAAVQSTTVYVYFQTDFSVVMSGWSLTWTIS